MSSEINSRYSIEWSYVVRSWAEKYRLQQRLKTRISDRQIKKLSDVTSKNQKWKFTITEWKYRVIYMNVSEQVKRISSLVTLNRHMDHMTGHMITPLVMSLPPIYKSPVMPLWTNQVDRGILLAMTSIFIVFWFSAVKFMHTNMTNLRLFGKKINLMGFHVLSINPSVNHLKLIVVWPRHDDWDAAQ